MNYYLKLKNLFQRHGITDEKMFNFIYKRIEFIDYSNNELKDTRGIYYKYNENKQLMDFELYIPYLINDETVLLSIRPYMQAIYAYNNLYQKYIANYESELFAIYFEKTYLKENPNEKLAEYLNKIYSSIRAQEECTKYKIALEKEEQLEKILNNANNSFETMKQSIKKLVKKTNRK